MNNVLKIALIIVSALTFPYYALAGGCCSVPETDSPRGRVIEESGHHEDSIGFPDNTSQPEENPEIGIVLENSSSDHHSPDSMTLRDFPFSSPYIVHDEPQPSVPENRQIDSPERDGDLPEQDVGFPFDQDVGFPFDNEVIAPR